MRHTATKPRASKLPSAAAIGALFEWAAHASRSELRTIPAEPVRQPVEAPEEVPVAVPEEMVEEPAPEGLAEAEAEGGTATAPNAVADEPDQEDTGPTETPAETPAQPQEILSARAAYDEDAAEEERTITAVAERLASIEAKIQPG